MSTGEEFDLTLTAGLSISSHITENQEVESVFYYQVIRFTEEYQKMIDSQETRKKELQNMGFFFEDGRLEYPTKHKSLLEEAIQTDDDNVIL